MDIRQEVKKLFIFSSLDLLVAKMAKYLGFLIVINALDKEAIGLIGIAGGYLVFTGYLSISVENILLRDYKKIKANKEKIAESVSAYLNFWVVKTIAVFCLGIGIYFWLNPQNQLLSVVFIGLLIQRSIEGLTNLIQLLFYVDFRQKFITKINSTFNLHSLAVLSLLLVNPSLAFYLQVVIFIQAIFCIVWFLLLKKYFGFIYRPSRGWFNVIKRDFVNFSLWHHLSQSALNVINNIDPLVLSLFAPLAVVGEYTIALKLAGVFLILPTLFQKNTLLLISNEDMEIGEKTSFQKLAGHLKLYLIISITQLIGFLIVGQWVVEVFISKTNSSPIFLLTLIILTGGSVFNIARPFLSFATARFSLQETFWKVYAPSMVIGIICYVLMGRFFGVAGVAFANIINYTALLLLVILFFKTQQESI